MPVINDLTFEMKTLPTSHYGYSATRIDNLGATEYTLVSIVVDASSSVAGFQVELEKTLKGIVQACQYSPRADNLLLRLVEFSGDVRELHGFKMLECCRPADYEKVLHVGGSTSLYDAAENAISATVDYGKQLGVGGFSANAILFVITDGGDNTSKHTAQGVRDAMARAVSDEYVEMALSVLIGVNVRDKQVSQDLQRAYQDGGFSQYIEMASANAQTLATLAEFVSRSISMQSQALGSGVAPAPLKF
ncbi:hypothetical protein CCAX7_000920 [Capsulimonas corticalis]|uniref:VWFA domain-containing protein n=1 Tax=Capsulimonas corticalis TaxID=2219043 RepID=A0A402CRL1_9BACT|nr:hypothetical protein [Capsulimonas corticalis]BDI28041.1 hypothetical protein CCAX7_000920 [Capsulimonas corticalis]